MSRWRDAVRRELDRYREETGFSVLDRQAFLDRTLPTFRTEFPENNHPGQKVSQILQQLRKRGEVEFLERGTYEILELQEYVDDAGLETGQGSGEYTASEFETTTTTRSVPVEFRRAVLAQFNRRCPVSGVDHTRLLDVAHVLPWSEYPEFRDDLGNVLPLDKTHHAAYDAGLFTLDDDFRLHVAPTFSSNSDLLKRTLLERSGERLDDLATSPLSTARLEVHNQTLDWW